MQAAKAVAAGALHAAAHPVQTVSTCSHLILEASCKVLEAADGALDRVLLPTLSFFISRSLSFVARPLTFHFPCSPVGRASFYISRSCFPCSFRPLFQQIAKQGIAAPIGPSAHVAQALAVLQLLDTVARKAQACARVHASAQAAAMSDRANKSLAKLRYFFTGPLNSHGALVRRALIDSLFASKVRLPLSRL